MRSFILTAAIAAALVSTSLTAGYAASSAKAAAAAAQAGKAPAAQAAKVASSSGVRRGPRTRVNEQADPVPPVVIYPQWSMYASTAYPRTRLSLIESELGKATHDINVDRRRGELTRSEASFVRNEERAVRAEAIGTAWANGGRIPIATYAMLQDRVSDLNRTIHRYVINSANG